MLKLSLTIPIALILFATSVNALDPDEILKDPGLEARARALSVDIRCLVCQNQSIDDSDADLAKDLRVFVRQKLLAGSSDEEIKDYLVTRYGEFILLRPRVSKGTYILWFGPVLILITGVFGMCVFFSSRSRQRIGAETALSRDEEIRIAALISKKD